MLNAKQQLFSQQRGPVQGARRGVLARATATSTTTRISVKEHGVCSVKGTVRKVNEDRASFQSAAPSGKAGEAFAYAAVFDGHGGTAVASWLSEKLLPVIQQNWTAAAPEQSLTDAFLAADRKLLSVKAGFMGLGERGVGGSKCGATAAVALLYADPNNTGKTMLAAANVGDARTVLISGDEVVQLSVDHVPDVEAERKRIERFNPNPKLPLVRYVGGTWRVGGLLALSRGFGDAHLKGSLQFEGIPEGSDGYSSGFGVIAEPSCAVRELTGADTYLVVASDGLFAEEARGGGGGLDNQSLKELLQSAGNASCASIAEKLVQAAVAMGSTDDVTVSVMRLGPA